MHVITTLGFNNLVLREQKKSLRGKYARPQGPIGGNFIGPHGLAYLKLNSSNNPEVSAKFKTKPDWQGKKHDGSGLYGKKQASGTTNAPISLLGKHEHETFRVGDTQSKPVEVEIHNTNS